MQTGRVFVSHTSDAARGPAGRSFVQAALDAVVRAGLVPVDMRYFAAGEQKPAEAPDVAAELDALAGEQAV